MMNKRFHVALWCLLSAATMLSSVPAFTQDTNTTTNSSSNDQRDDQAVEGVVASSSHNTLVVRTSEDQFRLFEFDNNTVKPKSIAVGSHVRISSRASDDPGVRMANVITVTDAGTTTSPSTGSAQAAPIPASVRNLESDIERGVRKWRVGVRAGAALDPELFTFGVQSQLGPIFHRDINFRPNAEFAFGEVTDLIALNLEATYRLPLTPRTGRSSVYVGAGPALNFIHQSFNNSNGQGRDISFGNFDYETGFNVLAGVQYRRGTFFEMKTSLYSGPAPVLRLIVGYNF